MNGAAWDLWSVEGWAEIWAGMGYGATLDREAQDWTLAFGMKIGFPRDCKLRPICVRTQHPPELVSELIDDVSQKKKN